MTLRQIRHSATCSAPNDLSETPCVNLPLGYGVEGAYLIQGLVLAVHPIHNILILCLVNATHPSRRGCTHRTTNIARPFFLFIEFSGGCHDSRVDVGVCSHIPVKCQLQTNNSHKKAFRYFTFILTLALAAPKQSQHWNIFSRSRQRNQRGKGPFVPIEPVQHY
jgi:hypothetical protein